MLKNIVRVAGKRIVNASKNQKVSGFTSVAIINQPRCNFNTSIIGHQEETTTTNTTTTETTDAPKTYRMRGHINKVHLVGNLIAAPKIHEYKNEKGEGKIAYLSVATTERVKKGDKIEETTIIHNVVVFGKSVEYVQKVLDKGFLVSVEGALQYRKVKKEGVEFEINIPQIVVSSSKDIKVIYGTRVIKQ
ncbi:hypothetical protein ABK040_002102 [Willaertia magna]